MGEWKRGDVGKKEARDAVDEEVTIEAGRAANMLDGCHTRLREARDARIRGWLRMR